MASRTKPIISEEIEIVRTTRLGEATIPSPLQRSSGASDGYPHFVPDDTFIQHHVHVQLNEPPRPQRLFEKAGPREKIFFPPATTRAAIVTCGGLCPGLNNVIRSVFLELHMNYGVPEILGIRYGYQGMNPQVGLPPVKLTMEMVEDIHEEGGTILGSSRGNQEPKVMVDFLQQQGINILFCVGGDGTQRGTHQIAQEVEARGLKIAVVGIPKTIDNDIEFCDRTFGFTTAIEEAERCIDCAHSEAKGARNGIGLVKLMGREAGFIAAGATLASQEVNFTLVPEVPFALEGEHGFLAALRERINKRQHAVIVVAEGAGQNLFISSEDGCDASGNKKLQDIGLLLKQEIADYFSRLGPKVEIKYIDPSYVIRSVPANCEDDILCDQYGRRAAHAAMSGATDALIAHIHGTFIHVPLEMSVNTKRRMDPEGELWASVLSATGQQRKFE